MSGDREQRLAARLERERRARREAEAIAERTTRALYERQRELVLLEAVARAANEAPSVAVALQAGVDAVCAHTGWPLGHALLRSPSGRVESVGVWHVPEDGAKLRAFREATEHWTFPPGEGLPGRVLVTREPAWITRLDADANFTRREAAAAAGLCSGFAFPLMTGTEVVGVVEFFTDLETEPHDALLDLMAQVGTHLGRVVERERAAAELERSNAELREFASIASHDLSEPLRSVAGFVQLLGRRYGDRLDDDGREFIAYAVAGAERMRRMIDDLLEYARAGTAALQREAVDLGTVLDRATAALGGLAAERGAHVSAGPLPVVEGDRPALERVLQNLLANAMRFTADGVAPRIEVGARDTGAGRWEIAVADNGLGVPPEQAERVFRMFERLGGPDAPGGTGIGLAVCQRIVERHGGRIWIEPREGGGSVVRFTLAAAPGAPAPRPA